MNPPSLSDREKEGLRGPVETITEEWSSTVFDRDGKILKWRGNTLHGSTERTYSYDEQARLTRIASSNGERVDEFRYDGQGKKAQIRHIPARAPGEGSKATGIEVWFEAASDGEMLTDGGTVETTYNERDQPVEIRVVDDEGTLLFRIVHIYAEKGQLTEERLISENFPFPKAFRDQIPIEQRDAVIAQMKTEYKSVAQRTGLFGNAERRYVYDEPGRIVERHTSMGPIRHDLALRYNDHGDISESASQTTGFPNEDGGHSQLTVKRSYTYEYDEYGNWTSRSESFEHEGNSTTGTSVRHLTYHS